MDFKKLSEEEIIKANDKSYKVTIGDSSGNKLSFELSRVELNSIDLSMFIEFGFFVSVYKRNHVQDIE